MTGYDASVLNNPDSRLLIVAPNWLGDGVMAMPAVQFLRDRLHPDAEILVLCRPGQADLWRMQPAVADVLSLPARSGNLFASARKLKNAACTHALILPHSFRSALLPFLAAIPFRRGTRVQFGRRLLVRDAVSLDKMAHRHQQWEIAKLLVPGRLPVVLPAPRLRIPEKEQYAAIEQLSALPGPRLGLVPGAARGPSKQWPGERFREVADAWCRETGGGVCWLGTPADRDLCGRLDRETDGSSLSLAGETHLTGFAALLEQLDQVVVNDSGGMHLAAAVQTPLVAIFGLTDPAKTGPLSERAVVVQHATRSQRAIARKSDEATRALAAVSSEEVIEHVLANISSDH